MTTAFTTLSGAAVPYLEENVSTNVISVQKPHGQSADTSEPRDELFSGLRFDANGNEYPDFIFNRPEFRAALAKDRLLASFEAPLNQSPEAAVPSSPAVLGTATDLADADTLSGGFNSLATFSAALIPEKFRERPKP